ncbi:DUF1456 family protein [Flavobacterium sp.]|uniref:DUF1456 family protein n=1 Tax=Flavobacterium sp. TaxID=239 RepID=UPI0039E2BF7A
MNNNDIFKKLRVALQLRDEQIIEILQLVDFRMSKAELGALFRNVDHPNYMECGDQVLRNFLNGLVIHLRGTKENPKNAMDVINQNREAIQASEKNRFPKDLNTKNGPVSKNQPEPKTKTTQKPFKKPAPKKPEIVEKVKFNNGKKKK